MVELTNKYDKLRVFYYQNRMVVLPGKKSHFPFMACSNKTIILRDGMGVVDGI